ncbi:hypothetical protein Mapa_013854 [Marchantia paleacea]|nr:hypothetical protein Mapa_013854 [Marchantia paleacea]
MLPKLIAIVFMAMLVQPSCALIMRTGFSGFLTFLDSDDLNDLIMDITWDLDTAIEEGYLYGPGLLARSFYDLGNGYTMVYLLYHWNRPNCNLGRGSEAIVPIQQLSGFQIRTLLFEMVLPSIVSLLRHHLGYGYAIQENISLFYFPAPTEYIPRGSPALLGLDSSKNVSSTSAFNGTRVLNATDWTRASEPSRKFPVDPNGDCDIPSLVLTFGLSPSVDDQSTHGVQMLNPTDKIWSPTTRFGLVMQLDCNLVLYDYFTGQPLWSSLTYGKGNVCIAALTSFGALIVYDTEPSNVLFQSPGCCSPDTEDCWCNTILEVQDDGNMVTYISETEEVVWTTGTVVCEGGCSL